MLARARSQAKLLRIFSCRKAQTCVTNSNRFYLNLEFQRGRLAIPNFATTGLLPTGVYDCDLREIADKFVYNDKRNDIWNKFTFFINQVKQIPEIKVAYVDGSYVTDKVDPSDIDIVLEFANAADLLSVRNRFPDLMNRSEVKSLHKTDLLWRLETEPPSTDFLEFFQLLKPEEAIDRGVPAGTKKGILKIAVV